MLRNNFIYLKAFLIAGLVVLLGLFTAANGLEAMAPDVQGKIIEVDKSDGGWEVGVFGKEFSVAVGPAERFLYWWKETSEPYEKKIKEAASLTVTGAEKFWEYGTAYCSDLNLLSEAGERLRTGLNKLR